MSRTWGEVAQAVQRTYDALDWRALGDIYFHEDGEASLRERIPAMTRLGQELARKLLERIPENGTSLWVGAGIVEVPVMLAEVLIAGRTVVAANLRADECTLLNPVLSEVVPDSKLQLRAADAREVVEPGSVDHLGCISLFTDPETWPLLSDVAYGRIAPVQLDVEQFETERAEARELAKDLFDRLRRPATITTSAEEAPWFLEQAVAAGATFEATDDLIETAVVGDPVGFLRIE